MTIAPPTSLGTGPGALTDEELQSFVASSLAGCADTPLDPDEWFPVSAEATRARAEASRALAVCTACRIRAECLELSLRTWNGTGRYGIWGGLLEAERNSLRRDWRQGASVHTLLGC
jgi:hypothetical protein